MSRYSNSKAVNGPKASHWFAAQPGFHQAPPRDYRCAICGDQIDGPQLTCAGDRDVDDYAAMDRESARRMALGYR